MQEEDSKINKVFFITSKQQRLEKYIEYNIQNDSGINNFTTLYTKTIKIKDENYIIRVNRFLIYRNDLNKKKIDKNSNKYKATALLRQNRIETTFNGLILFKEDTNNFIYDFEFNNYKGWLSTTSPPIHIKFTLSEQILLFKEALEQVKTEQKETYIKDLILESISNMLENDQYSFDFYFEILITCYGKEELNVALTLFNINQVLIPKKFNVDKYSDFLTKIESNPNIISNELSLQLFYSLLLYFRLNFEKDKVTSLLNKKDLSKYYIPIIFENYDYYWKIVDYPDDFVIEILNSESISFKNLKKTFFLIKTVEKLLIIINKTINSISDCCKKINKY